MNFKKGVFSACKYFDNTLRQNLKDERYEMKVLMAVNEHLMDDLNPIDPVVHWTGVAWDDSDQDWLCGQAIIRYEWHFNYVYQVFVHIIWNI